MGSHRVGNDWSDLAAAAANYDGGHEDNGDLLQKIPCMHCYTQCPPTLQQATASPRLCQKLPDTHRQVRGSLLYGHLLLSPGPGAQKVLFVPSESLFSQSCVSSGGSLVGLMVTTSKRAYATPRSAAPRAPAPAAGHCWPAPPQETLKHSSVSVSMGTQGTHISKIWFHCSSVIECFN